MQVKHCVPVSRDFRRVCFAVEHAVLAPVSFGGLDLEFAGRESEQVGGNRLRLCIPDSDTASFRFVKYLYPV